MNNKIIGYSRVVILGFDKDNNPSFGILVKKSRSKSKIIARGKFIISLEYAKLRHVQYSPKNALLIDQALAEQDWNCYDKSEDFYKYLKNIKKELSKEISIANIPISLFISCIM